QEGIVIVWGAAGDTHADVASSTYLAEDNLYSANTPISLIKNNGTASLNITSIGKIESIESKAKFAQTYNSVASIAWSPNGDRVAVGYQDGKIHIFDAATNTLIYTFSQHSDVVNSLAWSPDGKRLISGSDDFSARIWDVAAY